MQDQTGRRLAVPLRRHDLHLLDQPPGDVDQPPAGGSGLAAARIVQARAQVIHGLGEQRDGVGCDLDGPGLGLELGEGLFDLAPLSLDQGHARLHVGVERPLLDRVDDPTGSAPELGELLLQLQFTAELIPSLGAPCLLPGPGEGLHRGGAQQPVAQTVQNLALDLRPVHALVVGAEYGASAEIGGASQAALADGLIGGATDAALEQAAEQPLPYPDGLARLLRPLALQARGDRIPGGLIHDSQVGHGDLSPFLPGKDPVDVLSGAWVDAAMHPAIGLDADIEAGAQDTVIPLGVAGDGADAPGPAPGRWSAFLVQVVGDLARRAAGGIGGEDAADDGGLGGIDRCLAAWLAAIAVEHASGGQAALEIGVHAPAGLLAQILEELARLKAFEGDVHLLHPVGGEGGELHACERQAAGDVRQVLQVPGKAVFVFDQHDIDGAGLGDGQQGVEAWPVGHGAAADRCVLKGGDHRPAARHGVPAAHLELILNRALVLALAGIPGIESGAHRLGLSPLCVPICRFRQMLKRRIFTIDQIAGKALYDLQLPILHRIVVGRRLGRGGPSGFHGSFAIPRARSSASFCTVSSAA